jgi:hypothetical protein
LKSDCGGEVTRKGYLCTVNVKEEGDMQGARLECDREIEGGMQCRCLETDFGNEGDMRGGRWDGRQKIRQTKSFARQIRQKVWPER